MTRATAHAPTPRYLGLGSSAAPAAAIAGLVVATCWWQGAFAVKYWAPVAIFALAALASRRVGSARSSPSPPIRVAIVAIWVLAAWTLLSMLWAESPARAWEEGGRTLLYAAIATAILATGLTRRESRAIGWAVVTGVAVIAAITLVALFVDPEGYFVGGRLERPIGHASATAALFAVAFWPLVAAAATRASNAAVRGLALGAASLCLGLAFLAQSRGVLVGLAAGAAVALGLGPERLRRILLALVPGVGVAAVSHWLLEPYRIYERGTAVPTGAISDAALALTVLALAVAAAGVLLSVIDGRLAPSHRRWARRGATSALAAALAAGLVLAFALGDPVGFGKDKLDEFRSLESPTYQSSRFASLGGQRYDLWRVAWKEFSSAPAVGVGAGSYPFDYYVERKTVRNTSDPHSLPLKLLAETGIVGALLFAVFLGSLVWAVVAGWRSVPREARITAAAFASGGAVVFGHALVEWLWVIPGLTGIGLLLVALAVAHLEPGDARPAGEASLIGRALQGAVLIAAAVSVTILFLADARLRHAREDQSPQAELADARTAHSLNPWTVEARYLQASALETELRRDAARGALGEARRMEPRNFVTLGLLGDLEARAGNHSAARAYYRGALSLNPRDTGLRLLARGRIGGQ
jgi:O-Antigen ligase